MRRRTVLIGLHWATIASLIAIAARGPEPTGLTVYAGFAALFCCSAALLGQAARPSPRLRAPQRLAVMWSHRVLYGLVAAVGLTGWLASDPAWGEPHRIVTVLALGLGALHGVFNLWRHTVLRDNALRLILPRALHGML